MLSAMILFILGFGYGFKKSSSEESTKRAGSGMVGGLCAVVIWVVLYIVSSEKLP